MLPPLHADLAGGRPHLRRGSATGTGPGRRRPTRRLRSLDEAVRLARPAAETVAPGRRDGGDRRDRRLPPAPAGTPPATRPAAARGHRPAPLAPWPAGRGRPAGRPRRGGRGTARCRQRPLASALTRTVPPRRARARVRADPAAGRACGWYRVRHLTRTPCGERSPAATLVDRRPHLLDPDQLDRAGRHATPAPTSCWSHLDADRAGQARRRRCARRGGRPRRYDRPAAADPDGRCRGPGTGAA